MPSRRFMFYQRIPQDGGQADKVVPAIFCADLKAAQIVAEALLKCNSDYADMLIPFEVTLKSNLDINRDKQYRLEDITPRNLGLNGDEQAARDNMEAENRVRKEERQEGNSGGYDSGNTPIDSRDSDSEEMRQFREWQRQNRTTNAPAQVTQGNQEGSELTPDEREVLESEPEADQQAGDNNQDRNNGRGDNQDKGNGGGNGKRGRSQPRQ